MVDNILNNGFLFFFLFFQRLAVDIKTVPDALMGWVALLPELLKDLYLKWYHNWFDFPSPMDSNLVTNILESAKRKLAKPVTKKEPITVELLTNMYPRLFCDFHVKNQCIICACLIGYAGLFRSNLRRCDIMIIILL